MRKLILSLMLVSGILFADDLVEEQNQNVSKKQYSVSYTYQGEKHFAKFSSKKAMDEYLKTFGIRTNESVQYRIVIIKEVGNRKITYIDEYKPEVIEIKNND